MGRRLDVANNFAERVSGLVDPQDIIETEAPFPISTEDKEFRPRVLAIPRGSKVRFPNSDPILHNVFSVSGA